ncbi:MAG: Gfo/Idh/MocA family oxidoreductase [Helicobacteraceae bacterium]|jgi:predicted dehydrogenase|nr:Gfo/Idh/MocA family oxidoreductase [Helicobacteraceae bacterium]
MPLKLVLIGLGAMGKNHYRVLSSLAGIELVGLCDNTMDEFDGKKVWRDMDQMLEAIKADAAIIAAPTFLHKEMALKCAAKGLHLFIEKPAAANGDDARIIKESAAALHIAVGHIERFNPVVTALKNELESKDIYSIAVTRVGPFPPRIADVGILTDLAVHDIDLIRYITGKEIVDCHIFASQKIHNHYEDNAILSFKLQEEIVATIATNWLTPYKKRKIEVATPAGYYEADLMSQELKSFSAYSASHSYLVRDIVVFKGEPLRNELSAFVSLCANGDRGALATIDDSVRTLEIVNVAKKPLGFKAAL